jgi:uncharacterized protein (TIGR01615 family)
MATHCSTAASDHGIDSESLADMIYGYGIVDQDGSQEYPPSNFTKDSQVDAKSSNIRDFTMLFREQLCEMLEGVSSSSGTAFEMRLLLDAEKAVAIAKGRASFNAPENAEQKNPSRRVVMNSLRFAGYNSAVCKSRWEKTIGHPAGYYEFIDVVLERSNLKSERFFVDIDFRAQFEIARPTDEYNSMLLQLPNLFVGRADKLCGIIKIMCDAARISLKERGMCIPPWRKYRYVQAKWLGSYKRTTKPAASRSALGALPRFPFSGIVLKGTGCDANVMLQMEKTSSSDRNLRARSKCTKLCNELFESQDRLLTRGQQEWEQDRHVNKISGLAIALSKAGLTSSSPSRET